jgi:hypothetical protein
MRTTSGRRFVAVFLVAMAVTHTVVVWQQRKLLAEGYGDFSAFYTAGLMARRGCGRQLYVPREQWRVQQEFASQVEIRKGPLPYVRPPFEALLFAPLTYFSYPTALAIWSALKLALLGLALWVLPRQAPFTRIYPSWFEVVLSLGFFPVFLDFYLGQDAVLLLLLLALALRRLFLGRDIAAGALLALALFKFHLVILILVVLILVGRARVLAGFAPTALALVAVSCAVAGPGVLYAYPAYLWQMNRASGAGMVALQSMPTLRGLLTPLLGKAPGPLHWLLLLTGIATLVCTVRLWRSRNQAGLHVLPTGFSLTIAVALLTSYYAYIHDLTLLLIPLLLLGGHFLEQPQLTPAGRGLLVAAFLALVFSPLYWLCLRLGAASLLVILLLVLAGGLANALRVAVPAH